MKHEWIIAFSFFSLLPPVCGVPLLWKELFYLGCFDLKKNEEESVKEANDSINHVKDFSRKEASVKTANEMYKYKSKALLGVRLVSKL